MRAERTRRVWNGFIVDESRWEPRQPQDLVRGVPDYQSVPDARPLPPNSFVGPVYTTLAAAIAPQATVIPLASVGLMNVGDAIGVMLDSGAMFNSVITAIVADAAVHISPPVPSSAASGNSFVDYRSTL